MQLAGGREGAENFSETDPTISMSKTKEQRKDVEKAKWMIRHLVKKNEEETHKNCLQRYGSDQSEAENLLSHMISQAILKISAMYKLL